MQAALDRYEMVEKISTLFGGFYDKIYIQNGNCFIKEH